MLDRSRALQILGLSESADEAEMRIAYRALRAHVEVRANRVEGDARDARLDELRDLERAWRALSSLPVPTGVIQPLRPPRAFGLTPRWLLAWALLATVVAAGLTVQLLQGALGAGPRVLVEGSGGGGEGGSGGFAVAGAGEDDADAAGGAADVEDAGPRARLVAPANVEGATLVVRSRDENAGEADAAAMIEGAADDTVYWLAPGDYRLAVRHPDCRDVWEERLSLVGNEDLKLAPEVCKETGWMVVQSNVAPDALSIDGRAVGSTGERKHPVPSGEHTVRVEKPGFLAWEGIVAVDAGQVLGIRPRLEPAEKAQAAKPPAPPPATGASPRPVQVAAARPKSTQRDGLDREDTEWHEEAQRWLLSRYDFDRSGALDSRDEVDAVPCEHWLGLEQSYDQSRLGLPLTRFYGFDGSGWRSGALGVSDDARDLAYQRMQSCGLR